MADTSWNQLYDEAKSGVVAGVPANTYEVMVTASRAYAKSRMVFMDLGIQVGPEAGKVAQVGLYVPEPGNRGAGFYFRKRIAGFGDLSVTFAKMPEGDVETALTILAEALVGHSVLAEIGVRTDGDYAGTNELTSTKPVNGGEASVVSEAAQRDDAAPGAVLAAPVAVVAPVAEVAAPTAAAPVADADLPF